MPARWTSQIDFSALTAQWASAPSSDPSASTAQTACGTEQEAQAQPQVVTVQHGPWLPRVLIRLDPSLLPDEEDELRWRAIRESAGYNGPSTRHADPADMMAFELPADLVALRRMIVLLILSKDHELRALQRGDSLECFAADPPTAYRADLYSLVDFAGATAHRRRISEHKAVG